MDLERDRQAPPRVAAGARRPGKRQGLPDEPPDLRHHPARRLRQRRSGHGPGGVVRPARVDPQGGRLHGRIGTAVRTAGFRRGQRSAAALRRLHAREEEEHTVRTLMRVIRWACLLAGIAGLVISTWAFIDPSAFPEMRMGGMVPPRSEEHTSELQSLMRRSYAVFFL